VALLGVRDATGHTPWAAVGVQPGAVSFLDLRSVSSTWDCRRLGLSTFPQNPCDPFRRPANYPRIWTQLGRVGLGEGDNVPLGIALAVVFYASALLLVGRLTLGEGAVYASALLAPATLLGVERGNVDLALLAVVAGGAVLARRRPWLAGVLKLYPAFATLVLALRRRWRVAAAATAALAAYLLATRHDLEMLRTAIPRPVANSYGAGVVADALSESVSWLSGSTAGLVVRLGVIALGLAAALLTRRTPRGLARAGGETSARLVLFWAGASVYAGTYVFGNNYDYRLVFLVLCIPQLCTWSRSSDAPLPLPRLALVALLGTLWLSSARPPLPLGLQTWYLGLGFPPEEALNWLVFAWCVGALMSGFLNPTTADSGAEASRRSPGTAARTSAQPGVP
jgi:hypothetical protein